MTNTPPLGNHTVVDPNAAYTQTEWAMLLNRHADTIKRARLDGRYPNAYQDSSGRRTWLITVSDVVAAGDLPADRVADRVAELDSLKESRVVAALREQLTDAQLEAARLRVEVAAAVARAETADAEKSSWKAMAARLVEGRP